MNKLVCLLAVGIFSGCATTNEMPLAPNVVRLDTQASGAMFTGSAGRITLLRAAEATAKRGYTHFRLEQAATSQGRQLAGISTSGSGSYSGTAYGNNVYGSYNSSGFATPIYAPTANVGVTVIMFKANEAGAKGAWNAAQVIKKQGNV